MKSVMRSQAPNNFRQISYEKRRLFKDVVYEQNVTDSTDRGRAWVELDMDNLRHNVREIRRILPHTCELMPAVKANAYGHGAIEISRELNRLGINAFCVASAEEGIELRKNQIDGEILILGYTHPGNFDLLRLYNLTQTVIDYEYAKALNTYGKRLDVHIKVDTGMNRLGESFDNMENILGIFKLKNLAIKGLYSHFMAGNYESQRDMDFTQRQLDRFENILREIEKQGYTVPKAHIQNSFGVFSRPDLKYDYARVGIALYGVYDLEPYLASGLLRFTRNDEKNATHLDGDKKTMHCKDERNTTHRNEGNVKNNIELKPVLALKARVTAVKTVKAGETIGYSPGYTAPSDMKLALLSIGYGDGIPRALSNGIGRVLISGKSVPVVGFVCMDQITVDVSDINNVKQGDVAVLIGKDGSEEISVLEIAKQSGTIPNEILARLGTRLKRIALCDD